MNQNAGSRHARYIVIDGPIGVGKTSLATLLAPELNARLIFERAEENPFLTDFYHDPARFRFQTQIFFLMSRFAQQEEFSQHDLFNQVTISDYLFAKDRLFAYLTLDEEELKLYERLHGLLDESIIKPDLVIYMQASVEVLLDRIRARGRPYERAISREYLEEVARAYNYFFFHYSQAPLLVVNTNEVDIARNHAQMRDLVKRLPEIRSGLHYYSPG